MRKIQFFINTISLIIAAFFYYSYVAPDIVQFWLVALFSTVSFTPLLIFRKEPIFNLKKMIPLIYFVYYPFRLILILLGIASPIPDYEIVAYNKVLFYVLLGYYFFYLPILFLDIFVKEKNEKVSFFDRIKIIDKNNISLFTKFFVISAILLKLIQIKSGFYFFLTNPQSAYNKTMFDFGFFTTILESFQYIAIYLLFIGWRNYKFSFYRKYLFAFVVFLTIFNIPTGSKQAIFSPIFFLLLCFNLIDKMKVEKYLIISFIIFILTANIISRYRVAVYSGAEDVGLSRVMKYKSDDIQKQQLLSAVSRVNLISISSSVFKITPDRISYLGIDQLFYDMLIVFIPRFLWKNKPILSKGNEMGRRYGIIDREDYNTAIGFSRLGSLYTYGGMPVVIIGMFLIGLFFAFLMSKFNVGYGFGRVFLLIIYIKNFIWIERDLLSIYGIIVFAGTFLSMLIFFNIITFAFKKLEQY